MRLNKEFDTETIAIERNRASTNKLLQRLREVHAPELLEPEPEPEPVKPLAPIPNKSLSIAHLFFPHATINANQVETIQRAVLAFYPKVTMADLKSPRRQDAVVRPRQIAMYLSKVLTSKSLPDIGRRFGGRDHTTVIHAVRKIATLVETDSDLAAQVNSIKEMIGEPA